VFARTTLLEIDTLRVPLDDAVQMFEDTVLPDLRQQPGFLGLYALTTEHGNAMLVTFWETSEQAATDAATGWYQHVLGEFATIFRSPPGREQYEVRVAVTPVGVAR
jgi:hypothetical protein